MGYCEKCGHPLSKEARFCANCGKAVDVPQNAVNEQRKTVYDGDLHKCPNCGELLNSFMTNCPSCGYEIRNLKTQSPVNELARRIEKAETVEEKIELITNFYVPNTKEDIYDFFILAVSNLEDTIYDTDDAWQAKLEQTYHKAKISFGNTPEFEYIEKQYNKTLAKVSKRGFVYFIRKNKNASIIACLIGTGIMMLVIGIILLMFMGKNEGAGWGGLMLFYVGILFLICPLCILEEMKKKKKVANKIIGVQKNMDIKIQTIGKNAGAFTHEQYEDATEQLKVLGFKNIIHKPEKKGLFDTEGRIKGISIAGNSNFSADDEFDVDSTIIIRYFVKNC